MRLCVYCGSSSKVDKAYHDAAYRLGELLAERGIGVVYGGANVGTMGALAQGALASGGEVIGVIPTGLVEKEVAHSGLTELFVVSDMHERKAKMAELADGFVALPGGLGTLEELFEMLTWGQLEFHSKPIALLDGRGFFDQLRGFLKHAVDEGFLTTYHLSLLQCYSDPESLVENIMDFEYQQQNKWW